MTSTGKSPSNEPATTETRPLGLYIRAKAGTFLTKFPYDADDSSPGIVLPDASFAEFSPTGDHIVTIEEATGSAVVRTADTGEVVATCGGAEDSETPLRINFATFSPLGTYLLTWARPVAGTSIPNLVIYSVSTGKRLAAFHQKVFHKDDWPTIQWSDDETIAARAVTNTIHFFPGDQLDQPANAKLGITGISTFALSRGAAPYYISGLIPGSKGAPGRLVLYRHPNENGEQICSRSTYRADAATFKWNPKGNAVLAQVSTSVDSTGKSYYGQTEVFFMDTKGRDQRIELPKEGPCYDASWSPTGNEFIIVYGYMPSRATLFDEKGDPVYDFGTGPRNVVSFSPHGRYVALAGFGNVSGAVEFWDKNKRKLVGRTELPCTILYSWSPCSRYFLSAVTSPRMRVDNGLHVVRFDGKLVHDQRFGGADLYQAMFRPALKGTYADPKWTQDDMIGGPVIDTNTQDNGSSAKKGGVYRPPGSRGAASFTLNERIEAGVVDKAKFFGASKPKPNDGAPVNGPQPSKRFVPGMDPDMLRPPGQGTSKSATARRKKKERLASAAAAISSSGGDENTQSTSESNVVAEAEENNLGCGAEVGLESLDEAERKVKKLRKKLRAIQTLKDAKKDGKDLNQEQSEKLAGESDAVEELQKLENRIRELSTH